MMDSQVEQEPCQDSEESVETIDQSGESATDRRDGKRDRRSGIDHRPDGSIEQRNGWDRRRGPGRRRSDERRSAEEGEMDDEQFAFIKAIDEYKRVNKRGFPTYTEILEIAKALGYRKVAQAQPLQKIKED